MITDHRWKRARRAAGFAGFVLAGGAALTACSPPSATVNTTVDGHDVVIGDGVCETAPGNGQCTFRAAIEEMNGSTSPLAPEMTVPAGTYPLTMGPITVSTNRVLFINKTAPAAVTIDLSGNAGRLFDITNTGILEVFGLHVTGANATGNGGVAAVAGLMLVHRSSFTNNHTAGDGGVFSIQGGGVVLVEDSTLSDNTADGSGDGVFNSGTIAARYSTIADSGIHHAGGTTALMWSIIAGGSPANCTGGGTVDSFGSNVDSDGSCGLTGPADVVGDPELGPLSGGVRVPGTSSPALNLVPGGTAIPVNGSFCDSSTTDQVGAARPHGTSCDAGAVEANAAPGATDDRPYDILHDSGLNASVGNLRSNDPADPEGDTVTIDATPVADPTKGSVVIHPDGTFDYTPGAGEVGADAFTYRVLDDRGAESTAVVMINLTNVAPTCPADTMVGIAGSGSGSGSGSCTDGDGDTLTYSHTSTGTGTYTVDTNAGAWTATGATDGDTLTIEATDGVDTDSHTITITVPVNPSPVCPADSIGTIASATGSGSGSGACSDPGDTLTYTFTESSPGVFAVDSGTGAWTATGAYDGAWVEITAIDTLSQSDTHLITVENAAPVCPADSTMAILGAYGSASGACTDPGDTLNYWINYFSSDTGYFDIDGYTGTFTGFDVRTGDWVEIGTSDPWGRTDYHVVTIVLNSPPTCPTDTLVWAPGGSGAGSGTCIDGDALTYTFTQSAPGLFTVDSGTGAWTTTGAVTGDWVEITATDPWSATDTHRISITINPAPVCPANSTATLFFGSASGAGDCTDPTDTLAYTFTSTGSGSYSVNPTSGAWSVTGAAGGDQLTIIATDTVGQADSHTITMYNPPPVCPADSFRILPGGNGGGAGACTDPGDTLTYTFNASFNGGGGLFTVNPSTGAWTATGVGNGSWVQIIATDSAGNTARHTISIFWF